MRKLVLLSLFTLLVTSTAQAQYFGQNKVQWEHFNFKILKTEHFDIYYYDQEADVVNDVGRQAERWYARLSRIFNHTFNRKPIVLYANPADFQQTTTTPEIIGQGTGGFTDPFMNRVVMPLTGDYAENDHVLGHEMVHVFQFDVASSLTNNRRRFSLEMLPLWLVEGMAEYLSKGRIDPLTAMWIRDATIHNRLPDLRHMSDPRYFPYRYGEALLAYIGGRFGDDAVVRYFLAAGLAGPDAAFERALGVTSKQLFTDWHEAAHAMYDPIVKERPANLGAPLIGTKKGQHNMLNVGPALSPDGRLLAFLSTREIFDIDLFLADAKTGKIIRRLSSSDRNAHFEALRFIDSAGSWSPDSTKLAFIVFEKGDNYLAIVDASSGHIENIRVPGLDAINSVAWSPDGHTLAMSGQTTAVSDLFLYDLDTKQVTRLTNDKYADLQPTFSPDGKMIAWVSDRGDGAKLEELRFTGMRIATLDLSSHEIHVLPLFDRARHLDPQFGPDGSLYFIANPEGIADVYKYSFADGKVSRVTHVQTGISGITEMSPALSVADKEGGIAVSLYEDDNHNIYTLPPNPPSTPVASLQMPPDSAVAGQLPPLRGTGSAITEYLQNPEQGLPTSTATFTTAPYSSKLHLAYVGPPSIGVVTGGGFGTAVGGSVAAEYTDILGEHNVGFTLQGGGTGGYGNIGDQIAGEAFYLNQKHRWNWGLDMTHFPYVTAGASVSSGLVDINGQTVPADIYQQEVDISRYDSITGVLQYPFNTTHRIEFSGGWSHQSFKADIETLVVVGNNIVSDTTNHLINPISINEATAGTAYVGDSSVFGFVSPVRGTRYRYEVDALTGTLHFATALADYRHYWFFRPITLAVRGLHYGRYGSDAENPDLIPIYLGDYDLVRGYYISNFTPSSCGAPTATSDCPAFDRLVGSRIAMASAEIRVPLFGTKEFGVFSGFIPTELAPFVDAGVAWTKAQSPRLHFSTSATDVNERTPVISAGVSLRMLLSYIPLEFYYAKPFQRPDKSWVLGFNIMPGW